MSASYSIDKLNNLKILTVISGLDFINYTRRATIESIHRFNPDLEILMFNSILNIGKQKKTHPQINFHFYHFWIPFRFRKYKLLPIIESFIRRIKWRRFFSRFDIIFLIDPNQYCLLDFLSEKHRVIYLVRDPSVLQSADNYFQELPIIKRADAILAISWNLCTEYFSKYYGYIPENIHLWPNSVDTGLWNYERWKTFIREKKQPTIGLAGNINYVIDIELLAYLAENIPECNFELAGKVDLDDNEKLRFQKLLEFPNVRHLGFIPYDIFPQIVINWDIGLVAAKPDHEYAKYLNNNKQYQYMSLGKPFVTYSFNADYLTFKDLVYIAEDKRDFVIKIRTALSDIMIKDLNMQGIKIAEENSSDNRAKQFLEIASGI